MRSAPVVAIVSTSAGSLVRTNNISNNSISKTIKNTNSKYSTVNSETRIKNINTTMLDNKIYSSKSKKINKLDEYNKEKNLIINVNKEKQMKKITMTKTIILVVVWVIKL